MNNGLLDTPENLTDLVQYQDGAVVSHALAKSKAGTVTLFAFDAGEGRYLEPLITLARVESAAPLVLEPSAGSVPTSGMRPRRRAMGMNSAGSMVSPQGRRQRQFASIPTTVLSASETLGWK